MVCEYGLWYCTGYKTDTLFASEFGVADQLAFHDSNRKFVSVVIVSPDEISSFDLSRHISGLFIDHNTPPFNKASCFSRPHCCFIGKPQPP